jgi:hypothetical protein
MIQRLTLIFRLHRPTNALLRGDGWYFCDGRCWLVDTGNRFSVVEGINCSDSSMFWHMIGGAGNSMFCIEEKGLNLLMLMTWSTCWIRFSLDKPHLREANFFYGSFKQFVNWSRMLVYSESQLRRLINQVRWSGPPRTRILLHLRWGVLQRCKHSYSEFDLYNDVLDSIICHGGHNFR